MNNCNYRHETRGGNLLLNGSLKSLGRGDNCLTVYLNWLRIHILFYNYA